MSYGAPVFDIDLPLNDLDLDAADVVDQIDVFNHRRNDELYTYASRGQEVVFVNARVAAVGEVSRLDSETKSASSSGACAPRSKRQAFFDGWREVPVYALDDLQPGYTLTGPAIIGDATTSSTVTA